MYKNIAKKEKLELKSLVDYQEGQVVSKTLVQNDYVSVTIFSFDKGEEISTHASGGDAMVTVLEGTGRLQLAEMFSFLMKVRLLLCLKMFHMLYLVKKSSKWNLLFHFNKMTYKN